MEAKIETETGETSLERKQRKGREANARFRAAHPERCREKARRHARNNRDQVNAARRKKAASRRGKGVCTACPNPVVSGHKKLCEHHWLAHLVWSYFGKGNNHLIPVLVQMLKDQNYRCPYTGEELVIGKNLSLDHKVAVALLGDKANDISNVEWVSLTANMMKATMTPQEFVNVCCLIAKNAPKHLLDAVTEDYPRRAIFGNVQR